jgi:hypothetical protein
MMPGLRGSGSGKVQRFLLKELACDLQHSKKHVVTG